MRQLTKEESLFFFFKISKLPTRQLTGYSYLTKILGICQKA